MKESEILSMIDKGKQGDRIHLGKRQGLQRLAYEDIQLLGHLLQIKYPTTTDLALEDLYVSDHDAVVLAKLVTVLPLVKFSLQGIYLGDQCVCAINEVLSKHPKGVRPSLSLIHNDVGERENAPLIGHETLSDKVVNEQRAQALACQSSVTSTSTLKTLIIAGLKVTDSSLYALAQIIIHNPALRKVSINWANGLTLEAALLMVKDIAIHNISLIDNDFHGFLYDANNDNPKGIHFINLFMKYVMNRNKELLSLAPDKKYLCYCDSFNAYNETLRKHFLLTQRKYELDGLCAEDFLCEPLLQKEFDQLVAKQADAAAEFSSVAREEVAAEDASVSIPVNEAWQKQPLTPIAIGNFDSPDNSFDLAQALMNARTTPTNKAIAILPPVIQPSYDGASSSSSSSTGWIERKATPAAATSIPSFSPESTPVIATGETKATPAHKPRYSEAAPITTGLKPSVSAIDQGLASLHVGGAFLNQTVVAPPQKSSAKKSL